MASRPLDKDTAVTVLIESCVQRDLASSSRCPSKTCRTRKRGTTLSHASNNVVLHQWPGRSQWTMGIMKTMTHVVLRSSSIGGAIEPYEVDEEYWAYPESMY